MVFILVFPFLFSLSFDLMADIMKKEFGKLPQGRIVYLYTLKNKNGIEAQITDFGAILVSLKVPDKNKKHGEIVLGFDSLTEYTRNDHHLGSTIGRYGNRIARGEFTLDGKTYHLAINNGPNHLHGGIEGFDKKVWDARAFEEKGGPALELNYLSKDGEEGYPGNLKVKVVYTITNKDELRIDYTATTDKTTVINLTHHSYFNFKDGGRSGIMDHTLTINADKFLPVDKNMIPTGELRNVSGTPFDFCAQHKIGERIDSKDEQLVFGNGYDHCFVLSGNRKDLKLAADVYEPTSGREMKVYTTEPGLQFYTGNWLSGTKGRDGTIYQNRSAFCLEAQHYPDSPNHPSFPSTILRPGEIYRQTTIYAFTVRAPLLK